MSLGSDEAAADLVFDAYAEQLAAFATGPGKPGSSKYPVNDGNGGLDRWSWIAYPAEGPPQSQSRAKLSMSASNASTIAGVSVGRVLVMASK